VDQEEKFEREKEAEKHEEDNFERERKEENSEEEKFEQEGKQEGAAQQDEPEGEDTSNEGQTGQLSGGFKPGEIYNHDAYADDWGNEFGLLDVRDQPRKRRLPIDA